MTRSPEGVEMYRLFSVAVVALFVMSACATGQGTPSGSASPGIGGPGQSPTPVATTTTSPTRTPRPSPTPAASPTLPEGPLAAGMYELTPFTRTGPYQWCFGFGPTGCADMTLYEDIRFTIAVPDGWAALQGFQTIWLANEANSPPDGAGLVFETGAGLLSDPCLDGSDSFIEIGPTVADFVDAVAEHPILDTTTPVDVELAGYSGKSFDLQVPADIAKCDVYRPWEWLYAQGPSHQWHVRVLDVDGLRVVVLSSDYAGTSEQRRTELRAIVDSIRIEP